MIVNEGGAPETLTAPEEPTAQTYAEVARHAAELAVAAADQATEAVCRSRSGNTARLEEAMHAAHAEACEAERYAGQALRLAAEQHQAQELPDGVPGKSPTGAGTAQRMLKRYAEQAVDHAVRAQQEAGAEATATALRSALERPLTAAQLAERESARRREEAQQEAEEQAATGMDRDNRRQADMNRFYAEDYVGKLGWTAGHVRVLEAAESGRLYWRNGQARQAAQHGVWDGGRKVNRARTQALHAARFLTAVRQDDGTRALTPSPMGQVALELARLHPAGLYETDQAAYEARYARAAKWHERSDDKKAAARRLPPLDRVALRLYRRPVTLAEQEARAQREAADQWEDEGGYCPGTETPRPAAPAAAAPALPQKAAPQEQPLLRRLFAPRADRKPQAQHNFQTVIRRPQRTLTPEDYEIIRDTALLNLHGALIMGIVDPVANPSPMSEEEGAWVRQHAWAAHFHEIERKYPWGFARWATCERGTCWNCLSGRCDRCVHRQQGGPSVDGNTDWVYDQQGRCVARLILRPNSEPCVWWCRCSCPKDGPAPARPVAKTAAAPADPPATPAPAPAATPARAPEADTMQAALW